MTKGLINDATSRASAMEKLVKDIAARQVSVNKKESDGFLFEIVKCTQSDKVVTVDFIVTNNQDDRTVRLDARDGGTSRLYDDAGNEIFADRVKLANKSGGGFVEHLMVSGLPTKCQFIFDGVSAKPLPFPAWKSVMPTGKSAKISGSFSETSNWRNSSGCLVGAVSSA